MNPRRMRELHRLVEALYGARRETEPGREVLIVDADLAEALRDLPVLVVELEAWTKQQGRM